MKFKNQDPFLKEDSVGWRVGWGVHVSITTKATPLL
jgi:hypothetical protein